MVDVLGCFDLNKRVERPVRRVTRPPDSTSGHKRTTYPHEEPLPPPSPPGGPLESIRPSSPAQLQSSHMPLWEQLMMYFGTVTGVLLGSAVMQFKPGEFKTFSVTIASVIISAVIALVIIPVVFEN
jgi:hypothetical protein